MRESSAAGTQVSGLNKQLQIAAESKAAVLARRYRVGGIHRRLPGRVRKAAGEVGGLRRAGGPHGRPHPNHPQSPPGASGRTPRAPASTVGPSRAKKRLEGPQERVGGSRTPPARLGRGRAGDSAPGQDHSRTALESNPRQRGRLVKSRSGTRRLVGSRPRQPGPTHRAGRIGFARRVSQNRHL